MTKRQTSLLESPPLGRRTFLAGALALAGAARAAVQTGVARAADPEPSGHIDAHVHVWTPDVTRWPLAAGFKAEEMAPRSFTPEELLAHARPCGVSRIVLVQMSYYGSDNSYMLDAMARFPGVFSGIAVIDENAAPADEMRRLKGLGVRGFRIRPGDTSPDRWLATAGMKDMWRCGAAEGLAMCCLVNPNALTAIDQMCHEHRDTPVVIDHFARIGIDGEIREAEVAALCRLARHPRVYVKTSAFYALGKKRPPYDDLIPMIRRLVEAFGPQRLMWATDCPYQVQEHTYDQSLALVRDRLDFLSADDRKWLLGRTAAGLFF